MSRSPVKASDAIADMIAMGRARAVTDSIVGLHRSSAMLGQAMIGQVLQGMLHMDTRKMSMAEVERRNELIVNLMDSMSRTQHVLNQTPETQLGAPPVIEGEVVPGAALEEYQEAYDALADRPAEGNG
jgi:hypothetical protein